MEQLPPSYESINGRSKDIFYEEDIKIPDDTVKIITNEKEYIIERKNLKNKNESYFGKYFLRPKDGNNSKFENVLNWSLNNGHYEDFIVNILNFDPIEWAFTNKTQSITEKKELMTIMENLNLKNYFESTSYGENWIIQLKMNEIKEILCKDYVCKRLCEILKRAINIALNSCVFNPEFEISKVGKIAIGKKDITQFVLKPNITGSINETNYTDKELLVYFSQYCEIEIFQKKLFSYLYNSVFQENYEYMNANKPQHDSRYNWYKIESVCMEEKETPCCYQSAYHRHIQFNLIDAVNETYFK